MHYKAVEVDRATYRDMDIGDEFQGGKVVEGVAHEDKLILVVQRPAEEPNWEFLCRQLLKQIGVLSTTYEISKISIAQAGSLAQRNEVLNQGRAKAIIDASKEMLLSGAMEIRQIDTPTSITTVAVAYIIRAPKAFEELRRKINGQALKG